MYTATSLLALAATLSSVTAHVALWDKGLFGINFPDQVGAANTNWNNNEPVNPLREYDGFSTDQWFAHGLKGFPPKSGDFMVLPAGGKYKGEVQCNRAGTTLRDPAITWALPQYACDTEGPLHVMNKFGQPVDNSKFGGTALAIAYTSDVGALQPNDMTIISVNYNSVWEREITYDIPAGLPPCPEGGCLCTWNWIHQASDQEGYGNEIYNNLYRCQVTGSTNAANTVQRGQVPRECGSNSANCVKGPKTPMYIYQASGNNIARRSPPPIYRSNWGFTDGAQNDIFVAGSAPAASTGLDNAYATGAATQTKAAPTATATSLPSGWTALGCMVDNSDTRALDGGSTSSDDMTIESCVASCAAKGFLFAGVEYGVECHCGSAKAILNSAPASECNVRCAGDQWSFCGGGYRMNMYRAPNAPTTTYVAPTGTPTPIAASALPTGWSALGCHVDTSNSRALGGGSYTSSNLTVQSCISSCAAKGMPYAGVEYGTECWCSPASAVNLVPATDGCNVRCGGDGNTVCGGGYRINVFQNDALIPASTATPSSSTAAPSSSTAAPSSSTTAPSSSTTAPSSSTTAASSSTAAVSSSTTTSSSSTSPSTTTSPAKTSTTSSSSSSSAAPSASLPAGWQSLGCTADSASARVLVGPYFYSDVQTPQLCIADCQSKGFAYAGLQYGRQCFCSKELSSPNMVTSGCTTPCPGDKSQMCGGWYRMNLYGPVSSSSNSSSISSSSSKSTTPAPTATGGDQIVYRTVTVTSTVTVNTCQSPTATLTKRSGYEGRKYPLPRGIRD